MHAARSVALGIRTRQRVRFPSWLRQGCSPWLHCWRKGRGEVRRITAPGRGWIRHRLGVRYKMVPHSRTRSNNTQQQQPPRAKKSKTMAATATRPIFSIIPPYSAPEFIPFDPSRLAVKQPRTHHRKRKPNVDPSPHILWSDIDDITPKDKVLELDLTEPGSQSQSDIGRNGITQREGGDDGNGNGSRSPTALDNRNEDGSSMALKGGSPGRYLLICGWHAFMSNGQ